DDLVGGKPIIGAAAAAKPRLTVWWSEDRVPEFIALLLQALHHFAQQGLYDPETKKFFIKKDVLIDYFQEQVLSNGDKVGRTKAEFLAMFCRPTGRLEGGPVPKKPTTP